jgi:hypothetical protein
MFSLRFNGSLIVSRFETIVLEDRGLKDNLRDAIYRLLLTSLVATDNGKWIIKAS